MAIVRYEGGTGGLERQAGVRLASKPTKHAAKKHAAKKHAAKKHAAKKHAAKHAEKHAAKHATKHATRSAHAEAVGQVREALLSGSQTEPEEKAGEDLDKAFHHLQRAGSVISLMGQSAAGELLLLHDLGVALYRFAASAKGKKHHARAAQGVLRAAEHLALAALYTARQQTLVKVPVPALSAARQMEKLYKRLTNIRTSGMSQAEELSAAARELLNRAVAAEQDPHLQHELVKAVDGICSALEEGL